MTPDEQLRENMRKFLENEDVYTSMSVSEFERKWVRALFDLFFIKTPDNHVYSHWVSEVVKHPTRGCHLKQNGEVVLTVPPLVVSVNSDIPTDQMIGFVETYNSLVENNNKAVIPAVQRFAARMLSGLEKETQIHVQWLNVFTYFKLLDEKYVNEYLEKVSNESESDHDDKHEEDKEPTKSEYVEF